MQFSLFPTPIGDCGIAWRNDVVVATYLPSKSSVQTAKHLAARTGASKGPPPGVIRDAIALMTALLEGEKTSLNGISCDFCNIKSFETKIYKTTRAIPAGETTTYGAIASQFGNKQLARKVGSALSRNPFPIIVPCHRVMGANQKLTGFSAYGGVETKLKMLMIEGVQFGNTPDLFDAF